MGYLKQILTIGLSFCLLSDIAIAQSTGYESCRPSETYRLFHSEAVESTIEEVTAKLTNEKLAWMFRNCFPNTLDTTVHYDEDGHNGLGDTFVYTGDIHAMWLRDSGAQVWPYVKLASKDEHLLKMIRGVILRQFDCIAIDPYANAFYKEPTNGEWQKDKTNVKIDSCVHERKWEID